MEEIGKSGSLPKALIPKVSIVVPVRNGASTIEETLRSLLAQTFRDFEVWVMDDGSTDGTVDIVTQVAETDPLDRIRLRSRSAPHGVSLARNGGIALARGELIGFLDGDDLWLPEKLADQVAVLEQYPTAVMAYCWTELMDQVGQRLGQVIDAPFEGWIREHLLVTDFISSGSNALIRRSPLVQTGGFDTTLTHSEDWDLWLRLAAIGPVAKVPKVQVLYRQQPTSASVNVLAHEAASRHIISRELQQLAESTSSDHPLPRHYHRIVWGNRYKYLAFKALDRPCQGQWGIASMTTLRFLTQVVRCDRGSLRHWQQWIGVLGKLILCGVLPPIVSRWCLRGWPFLGRSQHFLLTLTRVPRLPHRPLADGSGQ